MMYIYKIESPSGKVYIGQTVNLTVRKSSYKHHNCQQQRKLYASLMKYGFNNHKFSIIHELPKDAGRDTLNEYEKIYYQAYKDCGITLLNTQEPNGLHDPFTIKLISKNTKGIIKKPRSPMSQETKELIRKQKLKRGTTANDLEGHKKRVLKIKGSKFNVSHEERERRRNRMIGKSKTEDVRKKISLTKKLNKKEWTKEMREEKRLKCTTKKPVFVYDKVGNLLCEFESIKEATRKLKEKNKNVSNSCISGCCSGRVKTHLGMVFKLKA